MVSHHINPLASITTSLAILRITHTGRKWCWWSTSQCHMATVPHCMPRSTLISVYLPLHWFLLYSFNSLAILLAIFLKPIDVPEKSKYSITGNKQYKWQNNACELWACELPDILLNLTPLRLSRGSLQTSISHWKKYWLTIKNSFKNPTWTNESVLGSPWTQSRRNLSLCS